MNITYIIGNGFDLNLDLNTSYEDFYIWYKDQQSSNYVVDILKRDINNYIFKRESSLPINCINWSDLELGLGKYTKNLSTQKDFETVYMDLRDSLDYYLDNIACKNFYEIFDEMEDYDDALYNLILKIRNDVYIPFKYCRINTNNNLNDNINILTLNYTQSADLIFKICKGTHVLHLHGTTTQNQILGVYDESQIDNRKIIFNPLCKQYLIKKELLNLLPSNILNRGMDIIDKSDVICLFGVSLGETDRLLWDTIKKWFLEKETRYIIYFSVDFADKTNYNNRLPHLMLKELAKRNMFCEYMQFNDLTEKQLARIIISYNQGFFQVPIEDD